MTSLDTLFLLGVVQGITEFLPVSSSAHLFLLTHLQGLQHNGALDIMAHGGSLCAVMLYLRQDLMQLMSASYALVRGRQHRQRPLLLMLLLASLPALSVGFLLHQQQAWQEMRTLFVVGMANIIFALLLFAADRFCMTVKKSFSLSFSAAALLGLAQCFAFFPGASRAGVVITAARFMGFERSAAAHFSLLMSLPIIIAAAAVNYQDAPLHDLTGASIIVFVTSFLMASLAIRLMMAWLRTASLTPFVLYRLLLGGFLLTLM